MAFIDIRYFTCLKLAKSIVLHDEEFCLHYSPLWNVCEFEHFSRRIFHCFK